MSPMVRFLALGVVIDCEFDDAAVAGEIARLLAPLATSAQRRSVVRLDRGKVSADGVRFALFGTEGDPTSYLVHAINRVAVTRTELLAVHAGAVVRGGQAIVVAGPERAGKTTLTAALVRAGCAYLTDEAVAFDWDQDLVVPYPKPLSLSPSSLAALGLPDRGTGDDADAHILATEIGDGGFGAPSPVGMVLFPRFESGATPRLEPIGRGEAVLELAGNTFHFDRDRPAALRRLAAVTATARCFRMVVGDPNEAASVVLRECELAG